MKNETAYKLHLDNIAIHLSVTTPRSVINQRISTKNHLHFHQYNLQDHISGFLHSCPLGGDGLSFPSQSFFDTSPQSVDKTVPPLVWKLFIIALLFSGSPWSNICLKNDILGSSPYSFPLVISSPSISLSILSQFFLTLELEGQEISFLASASGIPNPSRLRKGQVQLCAFFSITISILSSLCMTFDLTPTMFLKRTNSSSYIYWVFLMGNLILTLSSPNFTSSSSFLQTMWGIQMPIFEGVWYHVQVNLEPSNLVLTMSSLRSFITVPLASACCLDSYIF